MASRIGLVALIMPFTVAQHNHHSWDWFHENMCGCTWTKDEGCGMSSKQLYKLITESDSLKLCEDTDNKGNISKTAEWVLKGDSSKQDEMEQRILKECQARLRLKDIAKPFEVCSSLTEKSACENKFDYCEWEAQDEKRCGIDEEKLVVAFVGENLKKHPLIENIIVQDTCSDKAHEKCQLDAKCAWMHEKSSCMANPALLFNAFIEYPALFAVMDSQEQSAACSSFTENVWHGKYCYKDLCHWERGFCMANKEMDVNNRTTVMKMKDHMCQDSWHGRGGSYTSEGSIKHCPEPGCYMDNKDGTCKATEIDESKPLQLSQDDQDVALYFRVLRSATYVQESRCNSLDDDEVQCRNVQAEHIDCPAGFFNPSANWESGGRRHNHNGQGSGTAATPAPSQSSQVDEDMKNIREHMSQADGGIGFQQQLGDIMKLVQTDQGEFMQKFQQLIGDPETQQMMQQLLQQAPMYAAGYKAWYDSLSPPTTPPTLPPTTAAPVHKDESVLGSSSHMVMICIACLLFAGVCGGFAWGVVCSNRMGNDARVELLETQYIRQEEMMRQGRV